MFTLDLAVVHVGFHCDKSLLYFVMYVKKKKRFYHLFAHASVDTTFISNVGSVTFFNLYEAEFEQRANVVAVGINTSLSLTEADLL